MEAPVAAPQGGFMAATISIDTQRSREFIDLTDQICDEIRRSGVRNGIAIVASQHTTAAIIVNEHEPELLKDLDAFLCRLAPIEHQYAHNAIPCPPTEQPNGHSHCQGLVLPTSTTIPIVDGRPMLGQYQRIFLVELDCPRPRKVAMTVMGN